MDFGDSAAMDATPIGMAASIGPSRVNAADDAKSNPRADGVAVKSCVVTKEKTR
jgi:hypothetical protein